MFNYEKLQKELNEYAIYLLNSIKKHYDMFLSDKKKEKLIKIINDGNIVVIDCSVGKDKIHINPNHELIRKENYKKAKTYFMNNYLPNELLKFFITLNISEQEYASLTAANKHQEFSRILKNGFVSYYAKELCQKNRLSEPECFQPEALEFIEYIEKFMPGYCTFKSLVFSLEYLFFSEKFFEYTGEDIYWLYQNFKSTKDSEAIEILDADLVLSRR